MSGVMDSTPAEDDGNVRKSSRLQAKPRQNVAKLLSEPIPKPKVTPDDRRRLLKLQAKAAKSDKGAGGGPPWTRPTATLLVGSEDKQREIKVFPCRVCDFLGRTANVTKLHEHKNHPRRKRCKICNKYLHSPTELEEHCLAEHQTSAQAIKCASCEYVARDQDDLAAHTEYEHYTGAKRNEHCREMVNGVQCTARFVRISDLRRHLASEHGLVAALDTVQEEFDTWDEFMRWKAQFELDTHSVYKIGYGRRHGHRRYMCVRSGRYKPVPDELRQRRPRRHRTIKMGFNCTATMMCKFPETGGVRVVVHPFHYGHAIGDVELPGLKPENAPDNWIRPDPRRKRKNRPFKISHVDEVPAMPEPTDGDEPPPVPTETNSGDGMQNGDSGTGLPVASVTAEKADSDAVPPEGSAAEGDPSVVAESGGGDGPSTDVVPGPGGDTGGPGEGAGDNGDGPNKTDAKPGEAPDPARLETLRRRPGPKSKCPPLSPPPPPEPEPEPEPEPKPKPRRGLFGRPLPPPPRPGHGKRYKKLLRRAKLMKGLRKRLDMQLTRLAEARLQQFPKLAPAPGGGVDAPLVGMPLEDVPEVDDNPPPLAVLRADPTDVDQLPDGVFPELELLTAPTDLDDATDTIFSLKMEVLSLRARLMRRAAVETGLRADALEAAARHADNERELREELERTRAGQDSELQRLRGALHSVFTSAQLAALENPDEPVPWGTQDYEQAMALRWLCNQEAFNFVRRGLKVPLPTMADVRAVVATGRPRPVADTFFELVRTKALEGDIVEDAGDVEAEPGSELRLVLEGPEEQTVEVVDSAAGEGEEAPVERPPKPRVIAERKPTTVRAVRLRPVGSDGQATVSTVSVRQFHGDADDSEPTDIMIQLIEEDSGEPATVERVDGEVAGFIGPHSSGSAGDIAIGESPSGEPSTKRARY
ncbi:uncharacterized protein LOC122370684 isoform X2 [Amphibalanus amphitrite]|uniref:uncharacterized protein LOC122370684 isoform X2 n=1 Tax=Amphibalanus amphitrite TaxID=1232801 RepID=UPI001C9268CF|nr:uncharacterized protein LOC122370684 isoform X2 [Amphibalanus amphitrite]